MKLPSLSRRTLLKLVGLSRGLAASAWLSSASKAESTPKSAQTHNGGRTQTNSVGLSGDGVWPFLNLFLQARGWTYNRPPSALGLPKIPLVELDEDGYVTAIIAGTDGVTSPFYLFPVEHYSGIYVLDWLGNGTLTVPGNGISTGFIPTGGHSFANLTSRTGRGRFEFKPEHNKMPVSIGVKATSAEPYNIRRIRVYRKIDEQLLDAGEVLGADFKQKMREARPGAFRSLGWIGSSNNGTNDCSIALWAHRKPVNYFSYRASQFTAKAYAGVAGQRGNTFTVSSGAPLTDKLMQHVIIPHPPANNIQTTCEISNSLVTHEPAAVRVANHNTVAGDIYTFASIAGRVPAPFVAGNRYHVAGVIDADTVTLSEHRGGPAIRSTAEGKGVSLGLWMSLSIDNGKTYHLLTSAYWPAPNQSLPGFSANKPTADTIITVVFDQATDSFSSNGNDAGMLNGVPPEIFVKACAEIGCNPHIVAPFLTMEVGADVHAVTDFMTNWVGHIKSRYPWMKPVVEPPNETWNGGSLAFRASFYAFAIAWSRWGISKDAINQIYGKWVSTLGQAVSRIYANDRTRYSMVCAIQAVSVFKLGGWNDNRFKCSQYVSANGGSPAYRWIDRGCTATYFSPAERFQCQELIDAFNWTVTHADNPEGQQAIAEAYVATCAAGNTPYTLAYNLTCFINFKSYLQSLPAGSTVAGMVAYEGGYSPDYLTGNWSTPMVGATQTNPCVLTLAATTANPEARSLSGHPATVGMAVSPSGIEGMTGLNVVPAVKALFTANSPNIDVGRALFPVGSTVCFSNRAANIFALRGTIPDGIIQCRPYHVVRSSGSTIQVSLSDGGAPIIPTSAGAFTTEVQQCFIVIGVAGNQITISYDASAQPAYIARGTLNYTFSQAMSTNLRWAGKFTRVLGAANTAMNTEWYGLASPGFLMENVSNFEYFGARSCWPVLDPNIFATSTPQWDSIVLGNQARSFE